MLCLRGPSPVPAIGVFARDGFRKPIGPEKGLMFIAVESGGNTGVVKLGVNGVSGVPGVIKLRRPHLPHHSSVGDPFASVLARAAGLFPLRRGWYL